MELPLGDKRQLEDFRARLKDVVSMIPYEGNDSTDAELYLETTHTALLHPEERIRMVSVLNS